MKKVSQLDKNGFFVGTVFADPSPLEPGVFLIPGGCIDEPSPDIPEGQRARWNNGQWVFEKIPPEKPKQPFPLWTYDEETNTYVPPVPQPEPDYIWDEDEERWCSPIEHARIYASLSRANFKLALLEIGELQTVKDYIDNTSDQRIKIMWEDSSSFDRLYPDLIRLASELGYTDTQLDAVFGIASTSSKLNINTATESELTALSGVGTKLAQAIIDGRPWSDPVELATISGISESMIQAWDVEA